MSRIIRIAIAVTGVSLILLSLYYPKIVREDDHPAEATRATTIPTRTSQQAPAAPVTILPVAEEASAALNSPSATAEEDLDTVELLLSTYSKHHDGNPVGENDEITAALLGKNRKHIGYLKGSPSFLNTAGQLIDRWGTPYFFHQISAQQTEILSAGPDRQFHTSDDISRGADDKLPD